MAALAHEIGDHPMLFSLLDMFDERRAHPLEVASHTIKETKQCSFHKE